MKDEEAIVLAILMVAIGEASAGTWYVDGDVASPGDGRSWGAAFRRIQEGINAASNMIVTVNRRFRDCLRRRVQRFVGSDMDVDEETSNLMTILSNTGGARARSLPAD